MDSLCHPCITITHLSYSVLSLKLPAPPCAVLRLLVKSDGDNINIRIVMMTIIVIMMISVIMMILIIIIDDETDRHTDNDNYVIISYDAITII